MHKLAKLFKYGCVATYADNYAVDGRMLSPLKNTMNYIMCLLAEEKKNGLKSWGS